MAKDGKHKGRERKAAALTKQERARGRRTMRLLAFFLVVVVAFAAGFAVRSQTAFVQSLGFPVSPDEAAATSSSKNVKSTYDSISARVEEVEDPLMREIRYLDKLIDELTKGKPMEKILRK